MAKEIPFGKRFSGDTTKIALKQGFAPKLKLDKGRSALYIGSSPIIENAAHILSSVDADVYILSDLEFDEAKTYVFSDCILKIDDRNGWVIATSDKTVSYILLDQAVGFPDLNFAKNLKIGTILVLHTCFEGPSPDLLKIIGWTHVSGNRYILTKKPDEKAYALFNAYRTICKNIKGITGIRDKGDFNCFSELPCHWEENVNGSGWVLDAKDILKLIKKALLILTKEQRETISEMLSERIEELSKSKTEFKKKMLTYLVEAKELLDK